MKALRIHDREVLETAVVQELFVRAFKDEVGGVQAEPAWQWCWDHIHNPHMAVIVVRNEAAELVGLAICDWNPGVWSPDPWVVYFYSNSEKGVVGALLAEMRVWGLGLGQKRVRWQNGAGISDKAYIRFFGTHIDASVACSVLVGDWKEDWS